MPKRVTRAAEILWPRYWIPKGVTLAALKSKAIIGRFVWRPMALVSTGHHFRGPRSTLLERNVSSLRVAFFVPENVCSISSNIALREGTWRLRGSEIITRDSGGER